MKRDYLLTNTNTNTYAYTYVPLGWTCATCGAWVSGGTSHYCPGMNGIAPITYTYPTPAICGVVAHAGAKGEPLACGFSAGHTGAHAWATLPTSTQTAEGSE